MISIFITFFDDLLIGFISHNCEGIFQPSDLIVPQNFQELYLSEELIVIRFVTLPGYPVELDPVERIQDPIFLRPNCRGPGSIIY